MTGLWLNKYEASPLRDDADNEVEEGEQDDLTGNKAM